MKPAVLTGRKTSISSEDRCQENVTHFIEFYLESQTSNVTLFCHWRCHSTRFYHIKDLTIIFSPMMEIVVFIIIWFLGIESHNTALLVCNSECSPALSWTHSNPPASASHVLELLAYPPCLASHCKLWAEFLLYRVPASLRSALRWKHDSCPFMYPPTFISIGVLTCWLCAHTTLLSLEGKSFYSINVFLTLKASCLFDP